MWGGVLDRAQSRKQPQVKRGSVEFILYGLSLPPTR
jgi:hypothetical protein